MNYVVLRIERDKGGSQMNIYAQIIEAVRRNNPDAIQHVFLSRDGKSYVFDDNGNPIGEYAGDLACTAIMPQELENQVEREQLSMTE